MDRGHEEWTDGRSDPTPGRSTSPTRSSPSGWARSVAGQAPRGGQSMKTPPLLSRRPLGTTVSRLPITVPILVGGTRLVEFATPAPATTSRVKEPDPRGGRTLGKEV